MLAVGQRMPAWISTGFDEYARRMPREASLTLREIRAEPRGEGGPVERCVQAEAKRIQSALPAGCLRVVLDERGKASTTRELAQRFEHWLGDGRDVAFVIGGADGLPQDMRRDADWSWSLSALTLPHGLVRVVVAEQLYRAWTILKNHPYHRD